MQYKNVFLFGAGASFGCGDVTPHAPPLGDKLFEMLASEFPSSWGSLPSDLHNQFAGRFEEGMDVLWKRYPDRSALLLQQMGIYFANFVPASGEGTLFRKLARKLVERNVGDVLLSTLNYDCLLEGEHSAVGVSVNYRIKEGTPPFLMKLHGSCNWFLDGFDLGRHVQYDSDMRVNWTIKVAESPAEAIEYLTGNTSLHPVMCLYTPEKPAPFCEDFFQHLHQDWRRQVASAERIAIIGAKPYPRDAHIWGPLADTDARLFCIGKDSEFLDWHQASRRKGETKVIAERFDAGFDDLWNSMFKLPPEPTSQPG